MTNDKARPVQERIAAMFGRSGYTDPRDGAGGRSPSSIRHTDVAAALGYVSLGQGRIAALVLETCYGSTLAHERELSKAWEAHEVESSRTRDAVILTRFSGALAVRRLAGMTYTSTHYAEYAYLMFCRREALQERVEAATSWLTEIHDSALGEFKRVLYEHKEDREKRREEAAQKRAA